MQNCEADMRTLTWLIACVAVAALSLAHAADPSGDWKPFMGAIYKFHSGFLADDTPPTAKERLMTIYVDGKTAKEIFNSIGPDDPEVCDNAKGYRQRHKKGIDCDYTAEDEKSKNGPYRCWIGLNLRTGDTVGTISC
jgi:hypothetical protein